MSPLRRRWANKPAPAGILILLVVLTVLGTVGIYFVKFSGVLPPNLFALERVATVAVLTDRVLGNDPPFSARLSGLGAEPAWRTSSRDVDLEELPNTLLPSWSIVAWKAGDADGALALLDRIDSGDETANKQAELAHALIEDSPVSEEVADWARQRYEEEDSALPEWIWLAEQDQNDMVADWLDERGEAIVRRISIAVPIALGLVMVSIGALFILAVRRFPRPAQHQSTLSQSWTGKRLWFEYLLAPLVSFPLSFVIGFAGGLLQSADLINLGSWVLAQVTIPIWMIYRLTPGPHAAIRMFQIRRPSFPPRQLVCLGFAGVALLAVAGYSTMWADPAGMLMDGVSEKNLDRIVPVVGIFILGGVIAPVCEEIVYRGFLYRGIRNKTGPLMAAATSSAVFALGHFYVPAGLAAVFIYGLVFCWLYQRSDSLWPGIIAHSLFNTGSIALTVSNFSLH